MIEHVLRLVVAFMLERVGDGCVGLVHGHEEEFLFRLLHRAQKSGVGHAFVAVDVDFGNLDPFGLMDVEEDAHGVFDLLVRDFLHRHIATVEALIYIVFAYDVDAGGLHVVVDDVALGDVELFPQVVLLGFGGALEAEGDEAGTVFQAHIQECHVAVDAGNGDLHIVVESCFPKGFDAFGDLLAGDFDDVAHVEREQAGIQRRRAGGGDAADFVLFRVGIVHFDRTVGLVASDYNLTVCPSAKECGGHHQKQEEAFKNGHCLCLEKVGKDTQNINVPEPVRLFFRSAVPGFGMR